MDKIRTILTGIEGLKERISDKNEQYYKGQAEWLEYVKNIIYQQFPELNDGEDERIRKEIIGYLTHRAEVTAFVNETKDCERWIAYLEKQKELAVIPDELVKNYKLFCEQGGRESALLINAINGFNKQKEQKPAEWSEEDEEMLLSAIEYVQTYPAHRQSVVNWLKSFRPQPHWKPSEEQMEALMRTITWLVEKGNHTDSSTLADLRRNLQKLM